MQIKLKNFQSIEEAELEFPTGVTLIQGPSASGKTAILRAFKACVSNPNGTGHYVKHGAKNAQVELTLGDDTLTWERTKSTTNYYYKDQEYQKASKAQASDFCSLGVAYNHRGDILNISDEWSLLFPFAESDTELFKLFEKVFGLGNTAKVIDTCKADINAITKDILDNESLQKACESKIATIKKHLPNFQKNPSEIVKQVLVQKNKNLSELELDLSQVKLLSGINRPKFENFSIESLLVASNELNSLEADADLVKKLQKLPEKCFEAFSSKKLSSKLSENETLIDDLNLAVGLSKQIEEQQKVLEQCERDRGILNAELSSVDICPLCGSHLENGIKGENNGYN